MIAELSGLNDKDRDRFIDLSREMKTAVGQNGSASFGWARSVLGQVDSVIGREKRNSFLLDIFGHKVESSKELSEAELFALAMWGKPTKAPMGGTVFCDQFHHDLTILQIAYNSQAVLPGLGD